MTCGCDGDAVDEANLVLCCALCCVNCSLLPTMECFGFSGKVGLCCLNLEFCCNPSADCLPCGCLGPAIECDGLSCVNAQAQCCCIVNSCAVPCNEEVPVAVTILGLTLYPEVGCCKTVGVSTFIVT